MESDESREGTRSGCEEIGEVTRVGKGREKGSEESRE